MEEAPRITESFPSLGVPFIEPSTLISCSTRQEDGASVYIHSLTKPAGNHQNWGPIKRLPETSWRELSLQSFHPSPPPSGLNPKSRCRPLLSRPTAQVLMSLQTTRELHSLRPIYLFQLKLVPPKSPPQEPRISPSRLQPTWNPYPPIRAPEDQAYLVQDAGLLVA